jgi:hypothetical protein
VSCLLRFCLPDFETLQEMERNVRLTLESDQAIN